MTQTRCVSLLSRIAYLTAVLASLCLAHANVVQKHSLPLFSLSLEVDKSDGDLIVFQDRLDKAVRSHLLSFFQGKADLQAFGGAEVTGLALASGYVWTEKGSKSSKDDPALMEYEVKSNFVSIVKVTHKSDEDENSHVSQSLLDLLLIEAFEGDNHFDLVHRFLLDSVLQDITDVSVTVMADGYQPYSGKDPSVFENTDSSGPWTESMTIGLVVAAAFCSVLTVVWLYLCCCFQGGTLFKFSDRGTTKATEKVESVTEDIESTDSVDVEDEDEKRMDAWAQAVTSIPVRPPQKKRRSRRHPAVRHPAQQHNSHLNSIEEADDECSTVCSGASASSIAATAGAARRSCPDPPASSTFVPCYAKSSDVAQRTRLEPKEVQHGNVRRHEPKVDEPGNGRQLEKISEVC